MKVLHIIDTFWLGGAQTLLKDLFEAQKDNSNIFVYSLRKREIKIVIDHSNVYCDPSKYRFSAGRISRLVKFIREHKIKILHCHLPHSQFTGYILKRFYFRDIKLIFHDHSDIMEPAVHVRTALKLTQGRADKIVTCSEHLVAHLEKKGGVQRNRIKVIPNFIMPGKYFLATEKQAAAFKTNLSIPADARVAGFAGRFVKRKGWRDFIEVAETISKEMPDVYFIMAGTGPDLDDALKIARTKNLNQIVFTGYLRDVSVFYKAIDVFVVPSYWEGMPLAPAEALAVGTPVAAYDAPGMHYNESTDKAITYAKLYDTHELALITKKFLKGDKKLPIKADLSYLSLDRFRKDIEELYTEIS